MSAARTVRRARNLVKQLEQLEQLGAVLELGAQQLDKDRRDRAAGVIEMVEVKPGVFAMPRPSTAPPAFAPRNAISARVLELEGTARDLKQAFDLLGGLWRK